MEDAVYGDVLAPHAACLIVGRQSIARVAPKDGDVQLLGIQAVDLRQKLPGPVDGFLLEIVAKAPVSQHFKQGVVVGINAYFLQIVVLSADTQTFLGVRDARMGGWTGSNEDILEGIHPRIGEHQGGVILHHQGSRGHDGMAFGLKEI